MTGANRTRFAPLLGFALVALSAPVARAAAPPPASSASAADTLFNDGVTLFDAGHIAEACAKFGESYRLDPANGTLQNLALCHARDGKHARALSEFSELVGRAAQAGQKAREQMARGQVEALEKRVARVTLAFPASSNVEEIALDGESLPRTAWSAPIPLEAGGHTFTFTAPGKRTVAHPLAAPDAGTMLHLDVPELIEEPKPMATANVDSPATPAPEAPGSSASGRRAVAILLGGAGVVMLGVGTYFGIRTFAKKSDGDADCNGSTCSAQGLQLQNEAHTAATWSTVTVGAGLGLVAAGAIVWLTAPHDAPARSARIRFVPALGARVAGGSLAVTF